MLLQSIMDTATNATAENTNVKKLLRFIRTKLSFTEGLARALLHKPKVVFADEPTSALDDESAAAVMDILDREAADATLVVVTHDQRLKDRYATCVTLNPQRP